MFFSFSTLNTSIFWFYCFWLEVSSQSYWVSVLPNELFISLLIFSYLFYILTMMFGVKISLCFYYLDLRFLDVQIDIFHQIWEVINHYLCKYCSAFFSDSPLLWRIWIFWEYFSLVMTISYSPLQCICWFTEWYPQFSVTVLFLFFFLFFSVHLCGHIFKFTNSFLHQMKSTI